MKVMKFGGTSVGAPERMKQIAQLIKSSEPRFVVLSALSGSTNTLVEIGSKLRIQDQKSAYEITNRLRKHYADFTAALYTNKRCKAEADQAIDRHFKTITGVIDQAADFTQVEERILLAQGELLSTHIFHFYLKETGVKSALIPALDFMRIDEDAEPMEEYIRVHLKSEMEKSGEDRLFITQGYICRNPHNEIDNLKRGGSDYTATLVGAALRANEIQIWTDIDGMHNNDPRVVSRTRPVPNLTFDEAAELAYFGAKILHPTSVLPAQKHGVPVRLLNTMKPEAHGTLISENGELTEEGTAKAVAAKDDITVIKIKSTRMLLAYGFMTRVFDIFERYKTPVDMITTSEVAVSLTIDKTESLPYIIEELEEIATVQTDSNHSIICVVGNFVSGKKDVLRKVFNSLGDIPVRMISYGGSNFNISVLVHSQYKKQSLEAINEGLFEF